MLLRPKILVVILAAGSSVRFKPGPKALPPPKGADLLNLTVKSLRLLGLNSPLAVANPAQGEVIGLIRELGCRELVNPNPERGMFSSIRLVFAQSQGEAALILPVDAALVSVDSILSVIDHFLGLPQRDDLAALPAYGRDLGHPPIIGSKLVKELLAYEGQGGLRGALAQRGGTEAETQSVGLARLPEGPLPIENSRLRYLPLDDPLVLTDIDTREDLERFNQIKKNSVFVPKPTPRKALTLLALAGVERKFDHSLAVAAGALRLARAIKSSALELTFMGGLLHDLAHGDKGHADRAMERVLEIGWPKELATVVGRHTELSENLRAVLKLIPRTGEKLNDPLTADEIEATFCVHLADKYIKGPKLVDLETRFNPDWALERPEAKPYIAQRREDALALDLWFKRRLNDPVEKILTTPSDSPLEGLLAMANGGPVGPLI
ncbi:MAG: NTP transferase domain-containing protein [Deltaproteobacteria bacterium]|jgi:CTP:molybdopterin cytidylyltransferase MocA|nr:NTP transferase domain-containing protein [Deltaproteobacteria bacterium]